MGRGDVRVLFCGDGRVLHVQVIYVHSESGTSCMTPCCNISSKPCSMHEERSAQLLTAIEWVVRTGHGDDT